MFTDSKMIMNLQNVLGLQNMFVSLKLLTYLKLFQILKSYFEISRDVHVLEIIVLFIKFSMN